MSSDDFLNDKQLKKLDRKLKNVIDRVGLDQKTESEVFDRFTLKTFEKLISNKILDIVDFPISTGKEGNVFRGITPDGVNVAIKVYRISTSTFKHIQKYIIGDPRFQSIHKSRRDLVFAWTQKEFKNLKRIEKTKILAPKPIKCLNNVLVMEYLGTENTPAPLIKDVKIKNPEDIFKKIISYIKIMYKNSNMVHADLSQFNIIYHKNQPYIIDFGQAVLLEHENSHDFLKRDIHRIVTYFNKNNITETEKQIYFEITGKTW